MSHPDHHSRQAILLLLQYLSGKENRSTYTDDFSAYMKQHGIGWEQTEPLLHRMEREGLIIFIGSDRYWIQMTGKGEKYLRWKGKETTIGTQTMKLLKIIGSVIGTIGTILTIIELLT